MKNLMNVGSQKWYDANAKLWCGKERLMQEITNHLGNNRGLGIVEIALIIVVIVALAFMFKKQITGLLNDIFKNVNIKDLETVPAP